jgi:hypothetical protein
MEYQYLLFFGLLLFLYFITVNYDNVKEPFVYYNITPTEIIDDDYFNINQDPNNYYFNMRVGDIHGVDLNCNNVNMYDLLRWIEQDDPNVLYNYVYKYDPSINIMNPIHSPRIFKMLLRNLPQKHKYIPILRKCLYKPVRIA